MYESKEQVMEKMREIAALMKQKVEKAEELRVQQEELKASALVDRGRVEELGNLYKMFEAKEYEVAEKNPAPKKKAPAKKRAKK